LKPNVIISGLIIGIARRKDNALAKNGGTVSKRNGDGSPKKEQGAQKGIFDIKAEKRDGVARGRDAKGDRHKEARGERGRVPAVSKQTIAAKCEVAILGQGRPSVGIRTKGRTNVRRGTGPSGGRSKSRPSETKEEGAHRLGGEQTNRLPKNHIAKKGMGRGETPLLRVRVCQRNCSGSGEEQKDRPSGKLEPTTPSIGERSARRTIITEGGKREIAVEGARRSRQAHRGGPREFGVN